MRIALFTLESLANATAVRQFFADHADDIAFVGLSDPYRASAGGMNGQTLKHWRRSGLRFLPYLTVNFGLPRFVGALFPGGFGGSDPRKVPLKRLCRQRGVPSYVIEAVNSPETRATLDRHGIDLIVSFHFDQIFDAGTLNHSRQGGINVHPSLLPRHRGPIPSLYALMEDPPLAGVTIHQLVEKIDAGAILAQEAVPLTRKKSVIAAAAALHEHGRLLLNRVLANWEATGATAMPMTPLPYCPFPDALALREARRRGVKLHDLGDWWAGFTTPVA